MKTITLPLSTTPEELYEKFSNYVNDSGGEFYGTITDGSFNVNQISGLYYINSDYIHITITKKPFYVSMKMLEKELEKYK